MPASAEQRAGQVGELVHEPDGSAGGFLRGEGGSSSTSGSLRVIGVGVHVLCGQFAVLGSRDSKSGGLDFLASVRMLAKGRQQCCGSGML